jgi:methylmalonyl-CoA/ethylmalonyl-CoA epimerase
MFTIDHLGIAVKSLETAKQFYRNLGLEIHAEETVAAEKVKLAMVPVGQSRIELLEPTAEDSPIAKFLAKRGEGMHHLALHVTGLPHTVEKMRQAGTRFLSDEIKIGAGGHSYIFVHPASAGGILLELCEDQPKGV